MATVIKPKRSETGSSVPTTANLAVGEMAVNTADQKIYVRDSADNIVVVADTSTATAAKNMFVFTATASQTTFSGTDDDGNTLSYSAGIGKTNIYLNGILLDDSDYTATNGTSVILSSGASVNDILTVEAFTISSIFELSDDASPQLGGSLDVNGNKIVSTSNGNIDIEPNGTGNVLLGNLTFDADQTVGAGQDNYVLTYDNSAGVISLEAAAGGGLSDVVDDTTPQLGGNLDLNSSDITGTGDINITGTVTATSYAGDGSSLTGISAGATGGGSDQIFYENDQTVTTNYTITTNKNAMTAGPITVGSGVTVTVPSGSTWTIV